MNVKDCLRIAVLLVTLGLCACAGTERSITSPVPIEVAPPPAPIVYSSPIRITKGGTYSGNWESRDPSVAAVNIETSEPVVIQDSHVRSVGVSIRSFQADARVTVRRVRGEALYPVQARATKGIFLEVGLFSEVDAENNDIAGYASGVRLLNYGEDVNRSGQVVNLRFNRFRNIDGRMADGNGGFLLEHKPSGQAIGLNSIRNARVVIAWNEIVNLPYQSQTEDAISTYESGGTVTTPIRIHDNYVQGNYAADPAGAIDFSGAGINIGDSPSKHPDVGFTDVFDNQVVSFQNAGIGVSAGHDQRIWNNRVVSAARASDGTLLGSSWRSAYGFWNYYESPHWARNELRDNVYAVADRNLERRGVFAPSGTPQSVYGNTELFDRAPTTADERAEFERWQQKVGAAGVSIGLP